MRLAVITPGLALIFLLPQVVNPAPPADQNSTTVSQSTVTVWDTGQSPDKPLTTAALAEKAGWRHPSGKVPTAFEGDAVLSNGRILAVFRKRSPAVEVYSLALAGAVPRLQIHLLFKDDESPERLQKAALVENTKASACLELSYQNSKGGIATARFRVKRGEVSLQVEPIHGAHRLRIQCPSRLVVLPDFFADDVVVNAPDVGPDIVELPSENFLLHLTGNGDAVGMCVFENRQQDVKVTLSGTGEKRTVASSEIGFEGKKIWVAILEGRQVWHTRDLKTADTGEVISLDWKMPFPAQWRADFTKSNGLTDSWEMLLAEETGQGYVKPTWLGAGEDHLGEDRRRWNTVLGWYPYPCWSDREGRGYLEPLKNKAVQFQGPVVIYPINRVKQTPLDAYTVVDVMRNTLGVGPCEYILDLEGQKSEYKGRATCSVRDELTAIYEKGRQKQERTQVGKFLDEGLTFVTHIRGRIRRYVDFGHQMRDYLAAQKKSHPELSESLDELDKIAAEIDSRVSARADKIQTPAHVAAMNEDFRKNVLNDDGPDALAKCKKYTQALVVIGDNQDELSGECRWVVKTLRQKAGLLTAKDPRLASIANEIRARTQETLRNPANHEGAHH
jgi:hypothetical protein